LRTKIGLADATFREEEGGHRRRLKVTDARRRMRSQGLAFFALLALGVPADALTLREAQTLPLPQLARVVLGDVGAMMVDVDRPPNKLTFYQRPTEVSDGDWTGMCQSMVVEPYYDQHWVLTRFSTSYRYSAPFGMRKKPIAVLMTSSTETRFDCQEAKDAKAFFEASEPLSALRALIGLQIFRDATQNANPLPFTFSCRREYLSPQDCTNKEGAQELAKHIDLHQIYRVDAVSCKAGFDDGTVQPYARHVCYSVRLKPPAVDYFIEMDAANPSDSSSTDEKLVSLRYTEARFVY
jgi:hypothetical protein